MIDTYPHSFNAFIAFLAKYIEVHFSSLVISVSTQQLYPKWIISQIKRWNRTGDGAFSRNHHYLSLKLGKRAKNAGRIEIVMVLRITLLYNENISRFLKEGEDEDVEVISIDAISQKKEISRVGREWEDNSAHPLPALLKVSHQESGDQAHQWHL